MVVDLVIGDNLLHLLQGLLCILFQVQWGSDETGDGSLLKIHLQLLVMQCRSMNNDDIIVVMPGLYNENIEVLSKSGVVFGLAGPDSTFIRLRSESNFDIDRWELDDRWIYFYRWECQMKMEVPY